MKRWQKRSCLLGLICALAVFCVLFTQGAHAHSLELRSRTAPTCEQPGKEVLQCSQCDYVETTTIPALGHDYSGGKTVDRQPTCETAGQSSLHCKRCNAKTSVQTIQPLGHNFAETETVVAPTCTEYGYTARTCTRCDAQVTRLYTDPTGHKPGVWIIEKEATCTQTGVRARSCTVCGAVTDQLSISKTEHAYTDSVVAPTCTASGYTLRTCRNCGTQTKTNTVKATGHDYTERVIAPTCTEAGYTLRICCSCGAQTKTNTVKAAGHSFPAHGTITKEPTCTDKGEETVACTACGSTKTQSLAARGHSYAAEWTTDKAATCTAKGEKSHHCIRCDKRKDVTSLPLADHVAVAEPAAAPTCENAGTTGGTRCAVCGKTLSSGTTTPARGHSFQQSKILTAATCTEKGSAEMRCTVCGKTETKAIPALGHSYSEEWTVDKAPTCTAQGEQSHHCTRCDKRKDVTSLPRTEHFDVTDPVVNPTCAEKGKTAGAHCKICGKILIAQEDIPALGHDFQRIATKTEPTCTDKGRGLMGCKICGATEEQDLPALGHDFPKTWTVDVPPSCTSQGEQSRRCTRCGKRTEITRLPRTEHTAVYEGVIEPTCITAGRADRAYCSVCGKELTEKTNLPAKGHMPQTTVTPATTKTDGHLETVCAVCGKTLSAQTVPRIKSAALSAKLFAFNGKKRTPTVTVKDKNGKTLKKEDCYTIKYAAGRKQIGRYSVTVTFFGNYTGKLTRTFDIVPAKVTGLQFTATTNTLKLRWNAVTGSSGYKIYLRNPDTGNATLLGKTKKTAFAVKDLLPGAVYTLCVRAYTKLGGNTFSGKCSADKTAATKPLSPAVTADVKNGKAVLQWAPCGDCVYEIYAAEKKNGPFTLLGTTKKTRFTSPAFSRGSVKHFKVKALVRPKKTVLSSSTGEILTVRFR